VRNLPVNRDRAKRAAHPFCHTTLLGTTRVHWRPGQVQALIALYNGTLLTLAVAPPETVTPEVTMALARCLVTGVLQAVPDYGKRVRPELTARRR
jgi:hypothetical protein